MPHKENFPYEAIATIGQVLEANAHKHSQARWRKQKELEHVEHAENHIRAYWLGADSVDTEDHLAHAFVRLAMAVAVRENNKKKEDQ